MNDEVIVLDKEGTGRLWEKITACIDQKIEENKQTPGSTIKYREVTITSDQYGQINIANIPHGLLIGAYSNLYKFGVLPYSNNNMRVYDVSAGTPKWAANQEIPIRIIYTEDYTQTKETKTGIAAKIKAIFGR